ncbi:glycosyltransferase [bacterium]|nr:MAG: glycosyltransferase [bacterium]
MRVLIATATAGAGHLQAANALEEAWTAWRSEDRVQKVDVLDYTPAVYKKAYSDGYAKVVAKAPELYASFFESTDDPVLARLSSGLRRGVGRTAARGFVDLVAGFRPDVVLAPHFLPLEILGGARQDGAPLLVSVVTDFEAHAFWMDPGVGLTCVAAPETKARLVARGVPARDVAVTGIPVSPRFAAAPGRAEARRRHGLRDDSPVLLVLAGGFGMGPVAEVVAGLGRAAGPLQLVVVCGRNEPLRRKVASLDHPHPTRVLGFTREIPSLMAAADLVVTKPGGLTVSESLALGRPLLVVNPIPGQEAANSDFLLERGAAVKAGRPEDLPARVKALFSGGRLAQLARAARKLGRPGAADAVCRLAFKRAGGKG